ncbi:MAG: S-layer protein [Candidatus Aenigmarchaeota archaeon]|nr:S-layer protein [Candidatus Aenigmarchaeota archaeon]
MVAMTLVSPALGATALKDYPTFLGNVGDFYVVVGNNAAASDVAGAIDVAANLAQLSFTTQTVTTGTSSATGTSDRKVVLPISSSGGQIAGTSGSSNQFPAELRNFYYSGLKDSKFQYRGTDHSFHEAVYPATSGSTLSVTHSLGSPINGTIKMRIDNNAFVYKYRFDDTISAADFNAASANSTTYTTPLKVTVAGKEFQIVAIADTTSFKALVGTVKTLSDGESVKVGDLTLKVVQSFSSTTAKIEVTDPSGNVVKSGINTGSTESVSYGGSTYNYKVLSSGATASGVAGYAQVVFGKGDIETTFDGSTTAVVSDWGSDWAIAGQWQTAGRVQNGDNITVTYNPQSLTDANRYYTSGGVFKGPGDYFELKYSGYYPGNFAKVTIEPVTGQTVYNSTAATGYSTSVNGGGSSLNGLKLSSGVSGTLVSGSTGYSEMYLLFNSSASATNFNNSYYWVAYKDSSTGRIVNLNVTKYPAYFTQGGATPGVINITDAQGLAVIQNAVAPVENITLSYGGPGATVTYTFGTTFSAKDLLNVTAGSTGIFNSSGTQTVVLSYQNRTTSSTSTSPELILGTNVGTADANDAKARVEGSSQDVSTQVGDLISDEGIIVYSVKSNAEGNKGVIGVPPETVYGLVKFGKETATASTSSTVNVVVPVTTLVAKLDSEITSADKAGKDLVLVGGPCKNSLVADLKTAGKFAYGCSDWPARNFAIIQVMDDGLGTGHQVVVVAGTRADDTRLASSVLQNYATKLSAVTGAKVEVSGAALASATVTPV